EDRAAVAQRVDALRGEGAVVRRGARADVVGRGQQALADDGRLAVLDLRHRVLLLRVAEEELARQVLEPEVPADVWPAVAVRLGGQGEGRSAAVVAAHSPHVRLRFDSHDTSVRAPGTVASEAADGPRTLRRRGLAPRASRSRHEVVTVLRRWLSPAMAGS